MVNLCIYCTVYIIYIYYLANMASLQCLNKERHDSLGCLDQGLQINGPDAKKLLKLVLG